MDVSRTDFKPTWLKARSSVLGFLIALTMLGTLIIDIGMPDGIAAWAPYSIAIALALLCDGARAIASVTGAALGLMLIGLWIGPLGDFQAGVMNRAIGAVTITGLGGICLYVDRARRQLFQARDALAASRQQLHSFVDELNSTAVVLCDLRGRVTESNHGAQLLTGYTDGGVGLCIVSSRERWTPWPAGGKSIAGLAVRGKSQWRKSFDGEMVHGA